MGTEQFQPVDRSCNCPHITENWFLQIAVETGVLGGLLFLALCLISLLGLRSSTKILPQSVFLMIIGISIAALFLHAWEDSAIAYTVWILLGMALPFNALKKE